MSHHGAGAVGSKWENPYKVKKGNKNSRKKCLERYENYIRNNPDLFNAILELEGKELGCWCKPSPCHGDILIKLFKERVKTNLCSLKSYRQEFFPAVPQCNDLLKNNQSGKSEGEDSLQQIEGDEAISVSAPLRLRGGGVTSNVHQENIDNCENQTDGMLADNPNSTLSNRNSQYVTNETEPQSFANQDENMSEQDMRDILIDAGYSIEDINDAISSKSNSMDSVSQILIEQPEVSELVSAVEDIDIDISINESDDPKILLEKLKAKNKDRPIIAHININFLNPKFEPLKDIIKDNIDILLISETKLDDTFPDGQFFYRRL